VTGNNITVFPENDGSTRFLRLLQKIKLLSMFDRVWMPYRHISNDVREHCFILIAQGWVPLDVWCAPQVDATWH
jgi:hypothetical protein